MPTFTIKTPPPEVEVTTRQDGENVGIYFNSIKVINCCPGGIWRYYLEDWQQERLKKAGVKLEKLPPLSVRNHHSTGDKWMVIVIDPGKEK